MQVLHYLTTDGDDVYQSWLDGVRDTRTRIAIQRRSDRLVAGNFGDHKFCRDGVWELRIDFGPGYRVYYAMAGEAIVLLLRGSDKRHQQAEIERAVGFWKDWQRRA
jgi:putative addiction module killer protein